MESAANLTSSAGSVITVDPDLGKAERQGRAIAVVLATMGRGLPRTLIQQVVTFAELVVAPVLAAQYSVSLELAIMGLYARNKTYRECKDCEVACRNIEDAQT
jgi:hypothetical protein